MVLLTKDKLSSFMNYYHWFHDSYITEVKYDYKKGRIELFLAIFWSGEAFLKDDGTYETNKTKLKMICDNVYQYNYKKTCADYIDEAYLKCILINKEEYFCFATDEEKPLISVICESIEYEELNY